MTTKIAMRMTTTRRAVALAAWAGWAWATMVAWGQAVEIDMENTSVSLLANQAGQSYALMAFNPGAAFAVVGVNLSIQVGNGDPTSSAPLITGVDAVTGTPFSSLSASNRVVNVTGVTDQFFNVDLGVNYDAAQGAPIPTVTIPAGAFRLATVTFDTTSLASGAWSLNVGGVNPNYGSDTYFTLASQFSELTPMISLGDSNLTVVPEWEGPGAAAGLMLVGWVAWRSTRGR